MEPRLHGDGRATLLAEVAGRGSGPTGRLGFRTDDGWWHATRVTVVGARDGRWRARSRPPIPAGRASRCGWRAAGAGIIALTARWSARRPRTPASRSARAPASATSASASARNAVDQRGNVVENYVADGPYQPERARRSSPRFVPPPGYSARATTRPTSRSRGCSRRAATACWSTTTRQLVLPARHRAAGRVDAWRSRRRRLAFRVFAGPTPAPTSLRAARRGSAASRPPRRRSSSARGSSRRDGDAAIDSSALRDADVPSSVAQTYTHYLPCGDQRGDRAAERARVARFHDAGLAVTTYFNPMICTSYQPGVRPGGGARARCTKNAPGSPYVYRYTRLDAVPRRAVRLHRAPAAADFYGGLLDEAVDDGYDGWMEDFGEYTPLDAVAADGDAPARRCTTATSTLYHAPPATFAERAARRSRASTARAGPARRADSQIVWGGDPTTDWGFDGLRSSITQRADDGPVGRVAPGAPTSAASSRSRRPQLTPELLERWIQFGFVVRRDAHRRRTASRSATSARGRRSSTPTCCRSGAATRSCARSSTPTCAAADDEYRAHAACRSCATSRSRIPDDAARRPRATTSTCSAPTCWSRRCSSRARRGARSTCRAGAGSTSGARRATSQRDGGAAAAARARVLAGGRERDAAARRSTSCRCSCAPARCCRCCRRTSTRWPSTATRPGRRRWASGPAAACSPSRAAARGPARRRQPALDRARGRGSWRSLHTQAQVDDRGLPADPAQAVRGLLGQSPRRPAVRLALRPPAARVLRATVSMRRGTLVARGDC